MWADLRYATRQLIRRPMWTSVVVSTLALGVGANTSMFALVDTMLFKPAAWNRSGQLVWISPTNGRSNGNGRMSYPDYLAYRDRATTLAGALAYAGNGVAIGGVKAELVNAGLASANYFDVLGIRAVIGRTFAPDDDAKPDAHPVVVLSHALWQQHFGADRDVIGRTVSINAQRFTIIGVAQPGFTGIAYADNPEQLWMPLGMHRVAMPKDSGLLTRPDARWLRVVGRLRDGETIARAASEVQIIARQLNGSDIPPDREKGARIVPVRGGMIPVEQDELGPMFALISIVPAIVLLVACANVANVLMARNTSRRKELAMRQTVGASRRHLVRLLLMESFVLAVLSAAVGFAVSFAFTAVIVHYGEIDADFSALLTPDRRALIASMAAAIGTTLLFGLAPAVTGTRFDVLPTLKDEGATSTAASGRTRLRRTFVVAQVALSLTLLIVAGLFVQSLSKAIRVDPGFESHGLATVSFDTDLMGYSASRRDTFVAEFVRRASSTAGVISVALTDILPLGGEMYEAILVSENTAKSERAAAASVSPRYFATMRLPVVRGREFAAVDIAGAAPVAIVNETLAERLWPGANPLGQRVRNLDKNKESWREVIGVARDAKYLFLTESQRGAYYVPLRQDAARAALLVRTTGDSRAALSSLTSIAHDLDPDLPLFRAQSIDDQIHRSVNLQRAIASLLSVLGGLTLLLAAVGLYGVAANSVAVRTREVGIRMSLGARATDVFRLVIRENLSLSLVGVLVGLLISAVGSKILTSFLFGLRSTDPLTFVAGATTLCVVTIIASYMPARRAANLDPLVALRHD
jgi:predicted permease